MNFQSFNLLEKLAFVRTGGSKEELEAANIIKKECEALGVNATLESFKVDGYEIIKASLNFIEPDFEVECVGVGMSSSTSKEGIKGDFVYIDSLADLEIKDVEDKICLIHSKLVNYKLYKRLTEKKAGALVLCCGSVYEEKENVDLDPYMYRIRHYQNGKIPAVCIRMKDAENILRMKPKFAHVVMIENELENDSHNVVATINGLDKANEIVVFTAHYDSVSYSKGVFDNASGSASIMQVLAYFKEHQPRRTLKFVWCGSEEMGLLGSKAYVEMHKEELSNYKLCINVDMIGVTLGSDIACCTSEMSLVNYIKYLGCEVGFAIKPRQGVYSSDSTPFADAGIPSVSFARLAPTGGAEIHSRKDIIDYLEETNYYKTCDFISEFSSRLVNSIVFPVEHTIPDNMKTELDYYLGRKDRPE